MAIELVSKEEVEQMEKEQMENNKIDDEGHLIMHKAADTFSDHIHDLISDGGSLLDYVEKNDLRKMLDDLTLSIEHLKKEVDDDNSHPSDIRTSVIFLGIDVLCLHRRADLNVQKREEKDVEEFMLFVQLLRKQMYWVQGGRIDGDDISRYLNNNMDKVLEEANREIDEEETA